MSKLVLVGNSGAGWYPNDLSKFVEDNPNSLGSRKLEKIKERRKKQSDSGLDASFGLALLWVEENYPEFK